MDDDKEQDQNESKGDYDSIPSEDEEKMNELISTSSGTTDNGDDGKPKDIEERICHDVYGKTFKDGHAFGGKKGSHSRTNQDHVLSKNIKKSGPSALEEGWRRVQPPQPPQQPPQQPPLAVDINGSSSSSSDSVDDSSSTGSTDSEFTGYNIDLLVSLSNLSRSDGRGREDIRAPWAAEVHLSITRKNSTRPNQILPASNSGLTNCGSVIDSKKSERSISCKDERIDALDTEKQRMKKLVIDETKGHGKYQEHEESKNTSEDHGYQMSKEKMKMKKKVTNHVGHSGTHDQEEEALGLIDKTPKLPRRYECRDCGVSYPTYQGLGGHRSIHKVKDNKNTTNIASSVGDDQEESSTPNNSFQTDDQTKESDECSSGEASPNVEERIDALDTEKQRMKKLVIDETKGHGKDQEHGESKNTSEDHGYQISQEKMKMKKKVKNHVGHSGTHDQEEEVLGLIDRTPKMAPRYKCKDCGISYPTYQGLGGHRSIHKVKENKNTANIASSVGDDQEESSTPNNSFQTDDQTKESDECSSGEASPDVDERIDALDTEKQRMKKLVIDETKGHGKDQESGESMNTSEDHAYQISQEKMKMKKKVKNHVGHSGTHDEEEEVLGLIDRTPKMAPRYECRDCGISYPTYQGLGGHRSIHKVKENKNTTNNIASSVGDDQEESSTPDNSVQTDDQTKESDECSSGEASPDDEVSQSSQ